MWPIPALDHDLVSVSFSQNNLVCCWIQKVKEGVAPLTLRAYKHYPLNNLELEKLILFNPTIIKQHIVSFLQEHSLQNAFIIFCLDGSSVAEKFVAMSTSTPHRSDFGIAVSSNILWEYRYVYPNDHGQYVFYVYVVPRSLVLQYQLLAIAARCNLIAITTKTVAMLDVYKNIFGTAFRRSQLAVDMMRYDNNIDRIISIDAIRRMVRVSPSVTISDEYVYIATAYGLFCVERID